MSKLLKPLSILAVFLLAFLTIKKIFLASNYPFRTAGIDKVQADDGEDNGGGDNKSGDDSKDNSDDNKSDNNDNTNEDGNKSDNNGEKNQGTNKSTQNTIKQNANSQSNTETELNSDKSDDNETEVEDKNEQENENEVEVDDDSVKLTKVISSDSKTTSTMKSKADVKTIDLDLNDQNKTKIKVSTINNQDVETETDSGNLMTITSNKEEVHIKKENGALRILVGQYSVNTAYPLSIDAKSNLIILITPSGNVHLQVLPNEAVANLIKEGRLTAGTSVSLDNFTQDNMNKVVYSIKGVNAYRFLGLIPVTTRVEDKVDVETGDVLSESKPWYLNLAGLLFFKS